MRGKILVVEDDAAVREMLLSTLGREGFEATVACDAIQGDEQLRRQHPDLILLDWMLPRVSGVEWARQLKESEQTRAIPIILLTARSEEEDKVQGLESGADDYVTKPFSPRELKARIKAVLRRTAPETSDETIEVSGLMLDPVSYRVSGNGQHLSMGPTEFRLLRFFMTHRDRVYTRTQLLDQVWGVNVYVEERTVDVHIRRLRKILAETGHDKLIQTVRGAGYRFSDSK
ncbi:phosphate regulon transcriptional regulator PhoB [Halorhodospira halochloris]|uniref:Phosphate regulon transcriptional regulatory protein PhoB n=1 Tax=Halorhodospira halochloris TaxID=1052 RepID=A0A0X8X944_HALHR|nr:phosphate regulon transcriptional regulator PhoB [Halorhodospira halochloris]MBK1651405.1 phosphate regulon transcriptional regulatory protein PhoB [Halorhodospira halochloris]MCG5530134.1 phosphate regulon transcriptional regulator PhoB [Halorhodospira halochloris]MCG5548404.1 phosphate regulon transcriptional regulator PhoB [Halorhodospira halochloris]BAU57694.1 phosphate regulon transcriptional regulatory protein PhoB [Halorhodospira halochloris]